MTPDQAFLAFSAIALAAVFLALVIGFRDDPVLSGQVSLAKVVAGANPFARSKERHAQVMRKTQIADEAMAAKARGERFVPPRDYLNR